MTELGPFRLGEELGRGGTGAVYAAIHEASGLPVAVKVLQGTDGGRRRSLLHEIQASAALHHPRIVRVFDFGSVASHEANEACGLAAGDPWMAMEHCNGGSLNRWRPEDWTAARSVLVQVLDGLAHAHARGLLHGDIKPGNVLRAPGSRGVKVSDLGIAAKYGQADGDRDTISGTPAYMAPELWEGRWRSVGPATDLYAVGCLAWRLVNGATPFSGRTVSALSTAHRHRRPGAWAPVVTVPDGFEGWVRQLLSKNPLRRWDRAADAARGLLLLDDSARETLLADASATWDGPTLSLQLDVASVARPPPTHRAHDEPLPGIHPELGDPMVTPGWRTSRPPMPLQEPGGLGSELLPLRAVPLSGRSAERDALWSVWTDVRRTGLPGLVTLGGGPGLGTTALWVWLRERIHELGVGECLWVDATDGIDSGVVKALRALLRTSTLPADAVGPWCRAWLSEAGTDLDVRDGALLESLLTEPAGPDDSVGRLVSPTARRSMLVRALDLVARRRGVVLVLEHAAPADALAFGHAIQRADVPPRAMVLWSADDGAPGVARIELGPMSQSALQSLGMESLGLDGVLANRVAEHAGGSPGVFVDVVRELARRGALEGTPTGLTSRAPLPTPGAEPWRIRMQELLAGIAPRARQALALGAMLDGAAGDVWKHACRVAGVEPATAAVDHLARAGAVVWVRDLASVSWRPAHPAVRAALLALRALAPLHAAAAAALQEHGGTPAAIGRQLLASGDAIGAFDALATATLHAVRAGNAGGARSLVDDLALAVASAPPDPRRRAQLLLARARVAFGRRHLEEAHELASRARIVALEADLPAEAIRGAQDAGRAARYLGRLDDAAQLFADAEREALRTGDPIAGELAQDMADAELGRGRVLAAIEATRRALASVGPSSPPSFEALCRVSYAQMLRSIGRPDEGAAQLDRAIADPASSTDPMLRGAILHARGEVERSRGNVEASRQAYEDCRAHYAALGHPDARYAELNLCVLLLEQGESGDAAPLLERAEAVLRRGQALVLLAVALVLRIEVLTERSDAAALAPLVDEVGSLLASTGFADPDLVTSLERSLSWALRWRLAAAPAIEALLAEQRRRCAS